MTIDTRGASVDPSSMRSPETARRVAESRSDRVRALAHPGGENRGLSASTTLLQRRTPRRQSNLCADCQLPEGPGAVGAEGAAQQPSRNRW
jgi:hypothetical protein